MHIQAIHASLYNGIVFGTAYQIQEQLHLYHTYVIN